MFISTFLKVFKISLSNSSISLFFGFKQFGHGGGGEQDEEELLKEGLQDTSLESLVGVVISNVNYVGSPDPSLLSMGATLFSLSSSSWASSSPRTCLSFLMY